MRLRTLIATMLGSSLVVASAASVADDGQKVLKVMSSSGPVTDVPLPAADHAFIDMMKFYVPAQAANGDLTLVEYYNADGDLADTRAYAKPLISVYVYGPVEGVAHVGFAGHGKRDAYAAISLDDGMTWKRTNLSDSATETSCDGSGGFGGCNVDRDDIALFADTEGAYPGDAVNIFQAMAGNRALVAWQSRYCTSGRPNYSLDSESNPENQQRRGVIADYMGIDLEVPSPDDLYLVDMYGVAGQQGSVDYAEDKFPQNQPVGEVPFACLWTARGVLVQGDDPRTETTTEASYMRWFKAERLTSGRRDVNRIEAQCVAGAGCAITWQEDPEGLRPGQGEGPGEGWSGAIGNSQTDIWYSYIPWAYFDQVAVDDLENGFGILEFQDYVASAVTEMPKPGIPIAMPMRLTDNAKCNVTNPKPYCNGSAIADNFPGLPIPMDYGLKDMCATTVEIPTGPEGTPAPICVTEDGLPLVGNIAATRPRLGMFGYSSGSPVDPVDSAFVVVLAEESKGLGRYGYTVDGQPCTPVAHDNSCLADEGKNVWYYSFSMSLGDGFAGDTRDGLLANLAGHGNQLNQPQVDWQTGDFIPVRNTVDMWDFGAYNFEIWDTEIARRGSLLAQPIENVNVITSKAKSGLIALPTWKQGMMHQGGPADVMVRRIIIPPGWTVQRGNPYAFRNMDCDNWYAADGSNPHYPDGLCLDSAINLSSAIPDTCIDSQTGGDIVCPDVSFNGTPFGVGDTNPILQGVVQGEGNTMKVLSWHQCPAEFTTVSASEGVEPVTCETDWRTDDSTLVDQSWYNPLDVAKGHRGYLDGDFVMMLYAWSPNWRTNAAGHDRYDLYIRRSFDGGLTWTTLPGKYKHRDNVKYSGQGTTTCESFRSTETGGGGIVEPKICNQYAAGAAEQARNVTQLKSTRFTTLDPRYAKTAASITADPLAVGIPDPEGEDMRDPSRYFVIYETGDNTTTAEGEAEAMDLYYSRAMDFGDNYQVWAEASDLSACYPSNPHGGEDVADELVDSGFCNEFDRTNQGRPGLQASEASLEANPGGEFMYGVWAQQVHDETSGELTESRAMVRRVWWIDGFIPTDAWITGQGSGN